MSPHDGAARRKQLEEHLREECESTAPQRVERYLEVGHQGIIPAHHFSTASTECIDLYRDGYFLSAVMLSHAIAEGIAKLVLERNAVSKEADLPTALEGLCARGIVTTECKQAWLRIYGSFRNDVHHMNPKVAAIDFESLAKRNLADLARIEREIFVFTVERGGTLRPVHPRYWDVRPDGTVAAHLRLL